MKKSIRSNKRLTIYEVYSTIDYLNEDKILKAKEEHKCIDKMAYILHDKDTYTEEDIKELKEKNKNNKDFDISSIKLGELKKPHWHIVCHLKEARDIKTIAKWYDVKENYINPPHNENSKTYAFRNMIAYLIHTNKDKYQYNVSDVKAFNVDVKKLVEDYKKAFAEKEAVKKNSGYQKSLERKKLEEIIIRITQGEIKEFNITDYVDDLFYTKHYTQIKRAFEYRAKKIINCENEFDVYYFYGESRVGKSAYAKLLAKDKGYSIYKTSSSNDLLNYYSGQDCILLNDLRGYEFGLTDLLNFLDPHNSGTGFKSRFINKVVEAKLIIITSPDPIETFFNNINGSYNESIVQLLARIKLISHFTEHNIDIYQYDDTKQEHIFIKSIVNPVNEIYPKTELKHEDIEKTINDFTLSKDILNNVSLNEDIQSQLEENIEK